VYLPGYGFGGLHKHMAIYAVYDGHGGVRAAKFCEKHLHWNMINEASFSAGNLDRAILNAFQRTDQAILRIAASGAMPDGTTAVVAVILGRELTVANVGDSEAVLARFLPPGHRDQGSGVADPAGKMNTTVDEEEQLEVIVMTEKHKPESSKEKARVVAAGGFVVFNRVQGSLAVSRALGDAEFKSPFNGSPANFVSAIPHIRNITLQDGEHILILACDGLWDVFTYVQAVRVVSQARRTGKNPAEAARNLTRLALQRGSNDNVTVIVVYL